MQTDFVIKDGIYLVKDQYEVDLHNDFDFRDLFYSVVERRVELNWRRSTGEWVKPNTPADVRISFLEVDEIRVMPRDPEVPFTEDNCLNAAGYWPDADWCEGVFQTNDAPDPTWPSAFEFMSGAIIAVRAGRAEASISHSPDLAANRRE